MIQPRRPGSPVDTRLESALIDAHGAACAFFELFVTDHGDDQLNHACAYLSSALLAAVNEARQAYYEGRGETYP
jgi:hypothetical protein